jgi:hypothetical protein
MLTLIKKESGSKFHTEQISKRWLIKDKEGHYRMTKDSAQENRRIFNVYTPNIRIKICKAESDKYVRRNKMDPLLKLETNIPLSQMDRCHRMKVR